MSTLVLTIKSDKSSVQIIDKLQTGVSDNHMALRKVVNYLEAAVCGMENAVVDVQTAAVSPVAASATNTIVYASIVATDTFVIGGVTLTCVTGAPATESEFRKVTNLATLVANLVACINAHSILGNVVTASSPSAGVVTVTCKVKGEIGNQILISATGTGQTLAPTAALAGGTGGGTSAATTWNFGL